MNLIDILHLLGGVALFLFGMSLVGEALEKSAGNHLKSLLQNLSSSPVKGFLLGAIVTAIIQSSSATTVMLVGFVNSGVMTLSGAIPIIMGANVGTTITSWILSLTGIEGDSLLITLFKPTSFTPVLALIGVILYCFIKNPKKKDIGLILLGFSVLIFGMDLMSDAVAPLAENEAFGKALLLFENPFFGVLAGAVITAVIQSSSASVGILQALCGSVAVSYGAAIPIIMGQNIGTCATALISSVGANKNAKRVAMVHLYFNIIGTLVILAVFYLLHGIFRFPLVLARIDQAGIAMVHTAFNLLCTALLLPFGKLLERLAVITVRDRSREERYTLLDPRLMATPAVAIQQCRATTVTMAETAHTALKEAFSLLREYDTKMCSDVEKKERAVDVFEDEIGSYLVELSARDLSASDSVEVTKMLHMISDFERLSDHAVNLMEAAAEMHDKQLAFSDDAMAELDVMMAAVAEILDHALGSYGQNDMDTARLVEPLEEVIDGLQAGIKANHIRRLKENGCTIEQGFILTDILTDLERVADHCSNIAGCVIEIAQGGLGMHGYTESLKKGDGDYKRAVLAYGKKYALN